MGLVEKGKRLNEWFQTTVLRHGAHHGAITVAVLAALVVVGPLVLLFEPSPVVYLLVVVLGSLAPTLFYLADGWNSIQDIFYRDRDWTPGDAFADFVVPAEVTIGFWLGLLAGFIAFVVIG